MYVYDVKGRKEGRRREEEGGKKGGRKEGGRKEGREGKKGKKRWVSWFMEGVIRKISKTYVVYMCVYVCHYENINGQKKKR